MFDKLFLLLISIFVPIIIFTGYKMYNGKNIKKTVAILALVLIGLEIVRFFCNAAFYKNAVTPNYDLKFSYISVLCIFGLFAAFNTGKLGKLCKNIFYLTALAPLILGLFNTHIFVNILDINAVCKAAYMIESGLIICLALFFMCEDNFKFNYWNILWSVLCVILFAGLDAFFIWYWKIAITINIMWYFAWSTVILTVEIMFFVYWLIKKRNK